MEEVIKFDLLGDIKLIICDEGIIHHTKKHYVIPTPVLALGLMQTTDKPLPYEEIKSVNKIKNKQIWALFAGIIFSCLGIFMIYKSFANSETLIVSLTVALSFSIGIFLLLGIYPLYTFFKGREFLVIATESEMVCLPTDTKKKKVNRVIQLLRKHLPETTSWNF